MTHSTPRRVEQVRSGKAATITDEVVVEGPMEIRLGGVPLVVLMRTPGEDEDLAAGFAITEGIVLGIEEIAAVRPVEGDPDDARYELVLADGVHVDPERFRRNVYTSSSCGVCGKASIDAVRVAAAPPSPGPRVAPATLLALPGRMRASQDTFTATGGLHAAAAFTAAGELVALREDIGRHNALDKLIGWLAGRGATFGELVVMLSGRVSFEMIQKAAVAGIPFVCGVSAASSLAIELAEELGMTLVGFLRDEGFNVYADSGRIDG